MPRTVPFLSSVPVAHVKIWVLAPLLETTDANIDYYYDFSQSIAEYTKVFTELSLPWQWQAVTIGNYAEVIDRIISESEALNQFPVILNLCDGDEINGTPGVSVVRLLEEKDLVYTGADEFFYRITTSKIPMKRAFDKAHVATPAWEIISSEEQDLSGIFERLGTPIIVKPAVSGGSMGVGVKNVVHTPEALQEQVQQMFAGYRGWNLTADGIIAESFIAGAEYTTLISGSAMHRRSCKVYPPVQRLFHPSLKETEKFLSFDRLWEIYEEETAMPEEADFYQYGIPDPSLHQAIQQISRDAYQALGGTGYTRIDIRRDDSTGKLYVLEANAQCGLSEDENYTSIGAILRLSGQSFTSLVKEIINDAFRRKQPQPVQRAVLVSEK